MGDVVRARELSFVFLLLSTSCSPAAERDADAGAVDLPPTIIETADEPSPNFAIDIPWLNAGENADLTACGAGDEGACESVEMPGLLDGRTVDYTNTQCLREEPGYCDLRERLRARGFQPSTLNLNGFGRVAIGAGIADAALDPSLESCFVTRPDVADDLYVQVDEGRIVVISVLDGNRRLSNGLGIGSSREDVLAEYEVETKPNIYEPSVDVLEYRTTNAEGEPRGAVFEIEDERVRKFRVGLTPDVFAPEGCL